MTAAVPPACAVEAAPAIGTAYDDGAHRRTSGLAGTRPFRVIRPDQAVQQDYRPERLNIEIGRDGRVARTWCG